MKFISLLFAWNLGGTCLCIDIGLLGGRLYLYSLIPDFLKSLDDGGDIGLVGIIINGYGLVVEIGLDALDALLEADILLDGLLTARAVYLWRGSQHYGLDVLGKAGGSQCQCDE